MCERERKKKREGGREQERKGAKKSRREREGGREEERERERDQNVRVLFHNVALKVIYPW